MEHVGVQGARAHTQLRGVEVPATTGSLLQFSTLAPCPAITLDSENPLKWMCVFFSGWFSACVSSDAVAARRVAAVKWLNAHMVHTRYWRAKDNADAEGGRDAGCGSE